MAAGNQDQIDYWNSDNGGKWVRHQDRMDRTLRPFSDHVISVAAPASGERVLDIGCGCGETSVTIAGMGAMVTGIDVSRPMLDQARSRPGAEKVEFVEADASQQDFGNGVFDLLFSRFGVMFFSDADAAFANLGRMTRSGGRIAFACWRPLSENPWMLKPVLVAKDFVELPPRPGPEDPGPFSFSDPERVTRILNSGGFGNISIEPFDHAMYMGSSVPDAVVTALEVGPIGGALEGASPETEQGLKDALVEMLSDHRTDQGVELPGAIWCVTATKV